MAKVEEIKDKNYEFYINTDLSEYAGKWIAIVDGKVVASGDRADEVYRKAKEKYPGKMIAIDWVPESDLLVL
ncbi:MAG: succinyl-CoA synthetase subunit alpha [Thermoplasmata archaeon]|nr:succinyl-CoA synthetase subunit alpha [Thermoplasmata archaeon]